MGSILPNTTIFLSNQVNLTQNTEHPAKIAERSVVFQLLFSVHSPNPSVHG